MLDRGDFPSILQSLVPKRILVVGDLLLDVYTCGDVDRISPEAPVPVMRVTSRRSLPGGAGNVALNLMALGNRVHLISRIGEQDFAGSFILSRLEQNNPVSFSSEGVVRQAGFSTPEKNRLISQSQQLMRLDDEKITDLDDRLLIPIRAHLQTLNNQIDIIAISDYGKGLVTQGLMQEIARFAKRNEIPIIVDPKCEDFSRYHEATLIKPNLIEACRAAGLPPSSPISAVAQTIFKKTPSLSHLLITRAKEGVSLFTKEPFHHQHFPIDPQEVVDVTGAGDCVLSIVTFAIGCKLSLDRAARLANVAGALAIRRLGCFTLNLGDVAHEILKREKSNKILTEQGHLFALRKISEKKKLTLIDATTWDENHPLLFITKLKKLLTDMQPAATVLLINPSHTPTFQQFLETLSFIEELDFILTKDPLHNSGSKSICERIHPKAHYTWKSEQFHAENKEHKSSREVELYPLVEQLTEI